MYILPLDPHRAVLGIETLDGELEASLVNQYLSGWSQLDYLWFYSPTRKVTWGDVIVFEDKNGDIKTVEGGWQLLPQGARVWAVYFCHEEVMVDCTGGWLLPMLLFSEEEIELRVGRIWQAFLTFPRGELQAA